MNFHILKTPRSEETVQSVYHFINNKFGTRAAEQFIVKAEKTIAAIARRPYMFK